MSMENSKPGYDPITALPGDTAREFNKNLDGIMGGLNADLDEVDREAGRQYAKKELLAAKERFNAAADEEIEKEEDRQAEKIALKVVEVFHEALGRLLAAEEEAKGFSSGDGENLK